MAQRSRKIFTIFLLVVLCIATVAMPFAYATVTPTDEVKYYYPVLPFDTLRVDYSNGNSALYTIPTRFSFPSTTDSYRISLVPDRALNYLYSVEMEFHEVPIASNYDFSPYEDVRAYYITFFVFSVEQDGEIVNAADCRLTFLTRSYFFVGTPFYFSNCNLSCLEPPSRSNGTSMACEYTDYEIDFRYTWFDQDNNTFYTDTLFPDHYTVDSMSYPTPDGQPAIWSYRFGVNPVEVSSPSWSDRTGGCLVRGTISVSPDHGYFGYRGLLIGDEDYPLSGVSYIQNNLTPLFPDSQDFTTWLSDGVFGFLSFEIIPGLSLWMIFATLVAIPLVVMFLKLFAGG